MPIPYFCLALSLSLISLPAQAQNATKSCYLANAYKQINDQWTPTAWSAWLFVYGILPVVAEIVVTVLTLKLLSRAQNFPDQEVISSPSVTQTTFLNIAKIFQPTSQVTSTSTGSSSSSIAQSVITVLMFIGTSIVFALQKVTQAECDFEKTQSKST